MAAEGAEPTRDLQQTSVDSGNLLVFGQRLLLGDCNQAPREPGPVLRINATVSEHLHNELPNECYEKLRHLIIAMFATPCATPISHTHRYTETTNMLCQWRHRKTQLPRNHSPHSILTLNLAKCKCLHIMMRRPAGAMPTIQYPHPRLFISSLHISEGSTPVRMQRRLSSPLGAEDICCSASAAPG